jgi:hypothetical protein
VDRLSSMLPAQSTYVKVLKKYDCFPMYFIRRREKSADLVYCKRQVWLYEGKVL